MIQDLIFALRSLRRHKGFTAAALLTLALCIGANTAIFTVLQAVVLRDLPFPDSDRLVTLYNIYPGVGVTDRGSNGVPDYFDRRAMTDVFSEVALIGQSGYDVGMDGSPQRIRGQYVTPSFFAVLGIGPMMGQTFTEDEATIGKEKVVVLSHGLWKDLFASDPEIIGKDVRLSGSPYRIIGVMPGEFGIPGSTEVRLWVPFAIRDEQKRDDARHSNNWGMVARLAPGVSISQAQTRIDTLNRHNLDLFPKYRSLLENARFGTRIVALKDELVRDVRATLYLLQIAVGVVLLIGCVNLANLMLVRSNVRMKELAVRFSLGAGRWRIARQLLTESVALALAGGALGVAVGYGGVRVLAWLGAEDLPRGTTLAIDPGVLAFTAAIAVLTGLIFGTAPLAHVLHRDLNEVFRGNDRSGTAGRGAVWARSALVVCQFAFAFILLIGAGLLTASFTRLLRVDPGFRPENVVTAQVSLPGVRYKDDAPARNFFGSVLERVDSLPGVTHTGATTYLPFSGSNNASMITVVGHALSPGENPPVPGWNHVNAGYFHAMAIPLQQGRLFAESDGPDSEKVVIIDQYLARRYWPEGNAVGAKITRGVEIGDDQPPVCTVIGIVGSVKTGDLAESNPVGQVYFHYKQFPPRTMHLVVKTANENQQVIPAIRREIQQADQELPVFDTKTMPERVSASLVNRRAAMVLCLIFAGLALLLAAVGIYGVLAYSVSQRTREFGIRVALGAEARDVVGMVIGQGLRMAAAGLVIGAVGAFLLTRLMSTMLFDVQPRDPFVFLIVAVVLALVAGVASLIPSARAVRIRPAIALRYE